MQLQPGGLSPHGAQGQATRPSCPHSAPPAVFPKAPTDLGTQVPPGPPCPPSHHQHLISHGKLDSDILGMSLWPTLNCKGWELQTSVLSANEPSIHCSRKDRETSGLWQTPSLPDPPVPPTRVPPLLTPHIAPSPEWGTDGRRNP